MGIRGRFAPSPTGFAHLGNAWAFLMAWLAVRSQHGDMVFRMEDLDLERSSVVSMQMLMSDIRWLGMDWDEGVSLEKANPLYHQSNRYPFYEEALELLREKNALFPCFCSRKGVRSLAGAPHIDDRGAPYSGTCRNLSREEVENRIAKGEKYSWRFRSEGKIWHFTDLLYGEQCASLESCGGDFTLQRSDGVFSYQLAVSVDDGMMGITQVVRGRDILPSTPRQVALLGALGFQTPLYAHIPLLLDGEGERLAKRHQSMSLDSLRREGVSATRIIGLLAFIAGLIDRREAVQPKDLIGNFSLAKLSREDYQLSSEDFTWLFSCNK